VTGKKDEVPQQPSIFRVRSEEQEDSENKEMNKKNREREKENRLEASSNNSAGARQIGTGVPPSRG